MAILTTLLNEIAWSPDDLILVLDDFHLVDAAPVDQALAFFGRASTAAAPPGDHELLHRRCITAVSTPHAFCHTRPNSLETA